MRTASASACTRRAGSSCGCAESQATTAPLRQMLAPPLRQQRGLAEPGRRLHDDDRMLAQALVGGQQALARDEVARHARRGDLEQQVTGAARGCGGRHEAMMGRIDGIAMTAGSHRTAVYSLAHLRLSARMRIARPLRRRFQDRAKDSMQGDPLVIVYLQAQLKNELTAINQYFLHYRMLKHWGFERLAKKEYEESIGEMKHADG